MLVHGERDRGSVRLEHLDGDDFVDERSGIDGLDRALVATQRPLVLILASDPILNVAVVSDGDGHVHGRGVRRRSMRLGEPLLVVLRGLAGGKGLTLLQYRSGRQRLHAAGKDGIFLS